MNKKAFYNITYGLYIVSSEADGKKNGYVANTVFQVTAEPPKMAVSCHKENLSAGIIDKSGKFSVSVLHREVSRDLLNRFGYKSGKDIDKFEQVEHFVSSSGTPVVTQDCIAWFDCKVTQRLDVGTHILFIGEIVDGDILDSGVKEPLTYTYYREQRNGAAPKNAPTYIDRTELSGNNVKEEKAPQTSGNMQKWECLVCGHIYDPAEGDPESGIAPGTPFEELPDDWVCPDCGAEKSDFIPLE